jgi:hypothetical protein
MVWLFWFLIRCESELIEDFVGFFGVGVAFYILVVFGLGLA